MNSILISYGSGEMEVVVSAFFPTSKKRIDKMVNLIRQDEAHREQLRSDLLWMIQQAIDEKRTRNREDDLQIARLSNTLADYHEILLTSKGDPTYTKYMRDLVRDTKARRDGVVRQIKSRERACKKLRENVIYLESVAVW